MRLARYALKERLTGISRDICLKDNYMLFNSIVESVKSVAKIVGGFGRIICSTFDVNEGDLVGYDLSAGEIPYIVLVTIYCLF
jgi:hypothetical protein